MSMVTDLPPAEISGYQKHYDFTQYSHDNNVNVIPKDDFNHLVQETFKCIADILRNTYGPYAQTVMITDQSETFATKDGYNVFNAVGFSHTYKRLVYLAIKKIIDRVNGNVGDGTTSCILLAEKLFNELERVVKSVDDKRNIMKVLTDIESYVLNRELIERDKKTGVIHPLNDAALDGLIDMAGNYDPTLTSIIHHALEPKHDENGMIESVRNVVVDSKLDKECDSTTYTIDYLPGDYRVRVNMDSEIALAFMDQRPVRIALYDHQFSVSDWNFFMEEYDGQTDTFILARAFNRSFMDNEYTRYMRNLAQQKKPVHIFFAEVKGDFIRDEIQDLAAVLKTEPIGLHAKIVEHDLLPVNNIIVHNGNCMCFEMPEIPSQYIETLKYDMERDQSGSLVKQQVYKARIKALSNTAKDTLITVTANSSIEMKVVTDKIDDCISIVNSAMTYGIVPNLFSYGYRRMAQYRDLHESDNDSLAYDAAGAIMNSIAGLFSDIWKIKHGDTQNEKHNAIEKDIYIGDPTDYSFDVIIEGFVPIEKLPTSAQYDLEVIAASISIVKYLLTAGALVFDAHFMKPVDDTGTYRPL